MNGVFAVRCFRDGKRKFTHELTRAEARCFRAAARTLVRYLTKGYCLTAETARAAR